MANNINQINYNIAGGRLNLYSKRTCSDNSEIYITSKLNMLYEQTVLQKKAYNSRRNLKKIIEGNHLDQSI